MATIKSITARQILNAKGNPAVEATIMLQNGLLVSASTPSGTSVSSYEAKEIHDEDKLHFRGQGVKKAVATISTTISEKLTGMDVTKQQEIDETLLSLDGTPDKHILGANALLPVSLAVARAAALSEGLQLYDYLSRITKTQIKRLPTPLFNEINGGKHALGSLDFQEFMLVPATSQTFSQSLEMGVAVYHNLASILTTNNLSTLVGDEGGFSPKLESNHHGFSLLVEAAESAGVRLGFDAFLGLDAASASFFKDGKYYLRDKPTSLSSSQMVEYYAKLKDEFPLLYIEDGLAEDDWAGWKELMSALSGQLMIVGDDNVSTNPYRLALALEQKAITAVIIKPNQIGTLTETLSVVKSAQENHLKVIVSHRSGETDDDFIADLAVAVQAEYCKFGAPARGERVAKYNRLLAIEKLLTK
ncbi:MAG TPA: phosphopyruvate hydratase [Patescibacteria group bacterium]|nr:phosphopyruvate hydratase [Patescibacteria group bacterium]